MSDKVDDKLPNRAKTYEQKRKVMEEILGVWAANPDLRLGQLLINATGKTDIFNEEDLTLAQKVRDFGKGASGSHSSGNENDKGS